MKKLFLLPLYWIITVSYGQWVDPAPVGGNIYYNNGNVGIGMDSAGALLDLRLSGDSDFLRLGRFSSLGRSQIVLADENRNEIWRFGMTGSGTSNFNIFNGTQDVISLKQNGNIVFSPTTGMVGIGIEPSHTLHVKGPRNIALFESNESVAYIRLQSNEGFDRRVEFANRAGGTAAIWVSEEGDALNVTRNGNVGVKTNAPVHALDVHGRLHLRDGVIQRGGTPISITQDLGLYSHVPNNWIRLVTNNSPIRFFTDIGDGGRGIEAKMSIEANGRIGIGTIFPDAKLTVKGDIHAEEVRVNLNVPGPDYVFEENYDLPTLESIQNYIQENKHLPEVPSAEEMEKDGIDLGVMNMLLLKKVEELTLHLIEQNEEVKRMKELLQLQQNEIEILKSKDQ